MAFVLRHTDIRIQAERVWLDALLSHAPDVRGLIICAAPYIGRLRGSRENYAAGALREAGFGTLIVSMLTPYEESRDPDLRYDVSVLHHRLQALLTWIDQQPAIAGLPLGILAINTIASACIRQLAKDPERISAIVTRAGRADLAGADPLRRLRVPLLMLIPQAEGENNQSSRQAFALVEGTKDWQEIVGASSGFIEPGTLEAAAGKAIAWFKTHLPPPPAPVSAVSEDEAPEQN